MQGVCGCRGLGVMGVKQVQVFHMVWGSWGSRGLRVSGPGVWESGVWRERFYGVWRCWGSEDPWGRSTGV